MANLWRVSGLAALNLLVSATELGRSYVIQNLAESAVHNLVESKNMNLFSSEQSNKNKYDILL